MQAGERRGGRGAPPRLLPPAPPLGSPPAPPSGHPALPRHPYPPLPYPPHLRCGGGNCGGDDRISGRLGLSQPPHPAPPEPPPPPPPAVGWQQCAGSERGTGIEGESGRWSATHGTAAAPTGRGTTTVATEIVALVVEVEVQAAMIGGAGARPGAGAGLGQGGRGRSGSRDGWERECERERDREREDPAGRASVGGGGSGSGLARGSSFGHSGPGGSRVSRANSTAMMAAPRDVHAPTGGRPPPVAAGLWARVSRRAGGLAAPCPGMDLALHPAVSALLLHCPSGLRGVLHSLRVGSACQGRALGGADG
ncbi:hypothetical protein PLESTF_000873000 [Pleodorina starrii]|nr:hypothetical protein PLESTF_000873000 [Pleodorina starrii]